MKVTLQNLTKKFPGRSKSNRDEVIAVNDFCFEIPDGQLIGLLGPSGCGKSTTLNLLSGLQKPTSGQIFFGDDDVTHLPAEKRGVGVVFQNYALYPHLTVLQNILFPLQNLKGKEKLSKSAMLEKAHEVARLVQIDNLMDRRPGELSGGQLQRLAIARALYKDAPVVILDEPTAALDPVAEYEIYCRFNELVGGKTAVYISHRLSSCKFCDRIAVFSDCTIKELGTHEELVHKPDGIYAEMFRAQAQYYI